MSSKDTPPTTTSPPAQIIPVDLATKAANPAVAQIRIPTVSTNMRPALSSGRPGVGPGTRPLAPPSISLVQPGQKPVVVPASVGQIITGGAVTPSVRAPVTTTPSVRPALARPILAQPAPSRPPVTPILRGASPVTGHALALRAPIQPALTGSIRLASPGSVHLIQTGSGGAAVTVSACQKVTPVSSRPVSLHPTPVSSSTTPRPGTALPGGGARAPATPAMAAVSFRPSGPLVTTARPSLSPTAGAATLVQTSVTKTIVTQNPAGVFKPITTQVSVSGALPVRVPAGGRTVTVVSHVSQPLAVSLSQAPTHIQVPTVPAAVGPPKTRLAVPAGPMKLVSGVSLAPVLAQTVPGTRTIQLPGASSKAGGAGASVPVARVTPQQHGPSGTTGYVTFVPANSRETGTSEASQAVNLTVSRAVVAPAMAIPNFSQTTLMYDTGRGAGVESGQSSVTITTLPPPGDNSSAQHSSGASVTGPASLTPARITPIMPGPAAASDTADRTVPGSPRPSILRKRPDSEAVVVSPVKGAAVLASPGSPPRPESSGSSTISATSSLPGLSGDEPPAQQPPPSLEPSPRKKPRKQQLPPRESSTAVSPEWATVKRELGARDRLEWNTRPEADWEGKVRNWQTDNLASAGGDDMVQDQADDEEELSSEEERDKQSGSTIRGKPERPQLLNSYRNSWKPRNNHYTRYSDVKSKDERRPTVNELANQKLVLQKINGWKIYHLSAGMEEVVDMEADFSDRLEDFAQRLDDSAHKDVEKELSKVQELIKANIQRSKVIQDQISEAKDNCQTIFEHKPKIQDIILKYQSKRDRTGKGRRDT